MPTTFLPNHFFADKELVQHFLAVLGLQGNPLTALSNADVVSEAALAEFIGWTRWPETGFQCPCGHTRCRPVKGRPRMRACARCRRQTSVLRGTALANTKLSLAIWVARAALERRGHPITGPAAASRLGVSTSTAWTLQQRFMRLAGQWSRDHWPASRPSTRLICRLKVRRPDQSGRLGPGASPALRAIEAKHIAQKVGEPRLVWALVRAEGDKVALDEVGIAKQAHGKHPFPSFAGRVLEGTHRCVSLRWLPRWLAYLCGLWNARARFNSLHDLPSGWVDRLIRTPHVPLQHLAPDT